MKKQRLYFLIGFTLLAGTVPQLANAQVITALQIDDVVQRTRSTFDVPGIAVAIVKDGKVIHAKGYGVRSLKTKEKVDEHTLFGIASNSKAFTAAALGMLMDEGKLNWDDKVIDYIPEFRLYNAYVTEAFTIRDLLTHRSGLGLGAGDLMFWPDSSTFTMKDVIHNLRYLKPVSGFRTKYDYDNLLYMVAGEVIERVSGQSWEAFIEERIMKPLQMTRSAGTYSRLTDKVNVIDAHAPVNGTVQVISRDRFRFGNSAGGINSSVADMSKWVIAQLNGGKYGANLNNQLFSEKVQADMWSPQTIQPVSPTPTPPYMTHFAAYGLGWGLSDVKGYKQVSHTGGLAGMVTQVTLLPELRLGIIVFTNQQSGAAFSAVTNTIKDSYLGLPPTDWVKVYSDRVKKSQDEANKITKETWDTIEKQQRSNIAKVDGSIYSGIYRDNWFGDVEISQKAGKLWFHALRSPKLTGELFFYKNNTFIVKWNNRSFDADAYVTFQPDETMKPASINMKPISPLTDFSFDFQDLDLKRVKQ
ncbi:serine hydrolase [Spirosoma endophyticum]|uniref:CubicO group peptidase, beta-lactamase class C family n=1 Tax=Spirosoma endophyticum TaxID=662367 RepID=A0A1I2HEZ6_9BACT|nr:serine hydrolase [Spirosoma endophyticum]SFF28754.1 CubicO group peptidase, beta-lactamase class C family [Spirosoma endophyticum]